jgi:hypothetical protein
MLRLPNGYFARLSAIHPIHSPGSSTPISHASTARRTIDGYEAIHRIRKGQARWISGKDIRKQNQFIDKLFDLPA